MDKYYVLDIPNDIDSLEKDYNDWCLLPYDLRKHSNDACTERYGCTNEQLYSIMKARLLGYKADDNLISESANMEEYLIQTSHILKEGFRVPENSHIDTIPGYSPNGSVADIMDKIKRSKDVHEMDDEWIVIYDFVNDKYPDYDLEELERMYNIYIMTNPDHKRISDNYSIEIWGNTVPNMYTYMKNKLETLDTIDKSEDLTHMDKTETELNGYSQTIKSESANVLQSLVRKADCYSKSPNRTVHESEVLESYGDSIKVGKKTYRQDMPGVVPFLTYHEYLHNTKSLDQKKINNVDPFSYVFNYKETAETLMDKFYKGDKQGLLEAGWNPEIKPTFEALKYAREKQIKWFDEYKNFETIDVSKFEVLEESEDMAKTSKLTPVFLILASNDPVEEIKKKLKRNVLFRQLRDFSHIGVSFESSLKTIYTFESVSKDRANKMIVEKIDDYKTDQFIHVLAFFVFNDVKKTMKTSINNYLTTQDNSIYSFDNVMSILTDKPKSSNVNPYVVIGSFIDSLFKISNLYDKVGKSEIGAGLIRESTGGKLFVMYTGQADKYKSKKVDKLVDFLKKNAEFEKMNFFGPVTTTSEYIDPKDYGYYTFDSYLKKYDNQKLMEAVLEIRDLINPDTGVVDYLSENSMLTKDVFDTMIIAAHSQIKAINNTSEISIIENCLNSMNKYKEYFNYARQNLTEDASIIKAEKMVQVLETYMKYNLNKVRELNPEFQYEAANVFIDANLYQYRLWKPVM